MTKVYLRATGINTFEWVEKPEDATSDAKEAVESTLSRLNGAIIEPAPKKTLDHEPGWIISTKA